MSLLAADANYTHCTINNTTSQEIVALTTENQMIVNGRLDIIAQEAPITYEITKVSNEIGKIQESLTLRADARAK